MVISIGGIWGFKRQGWK
ncbi:unnamed protein product [Linum tenue]|uniref:Uncharacterized protein n=1 Tax=Linum tenue TaxID=586396 RepID=A0AAV0P577_9ROSI|nr:unnamed protein product [Linum tenue]CAI0466120.1 unnamed protein product [Linum tenue]